MSRLWTCPQCKRSFRQVNQRHSCGTGDSTAVLRNKAPALVALYRSLEKTLTCYDDVEIVAKDRYVLFRTSRIFADLTFMRDALRLAIHLNRQADHPLFFKVVADKRQVSHVAKLHDTDELTTVLPFVLEAYEFSRRSS